MDLKKNFSNINDYRDKFKLTPTNISIDNTVYPTLSDLFKTIKNELHTEKMLAMLLDQVLKNIDVQPIWDNINLEGDKSQIGLRVSGGIGHLYSH